MSNYTKQRIQIMQTLVLTGLVNDEIKDIAIQKGKYTVLEASSQDIDGNVFLSMTIANLFGDHFELLLQCSEVIDLFLNSETVYSH